MPDISDSKRRKVAHRIAFDYLERQIAKMPAYASAEKYWAQAWAEVVQLTRDTDDTLLQELLATEYWELERIWLRERGDNV